MPGGVQPCRAPAALTLPARHARCSLVAHACHHPAAPPRPPAAEPAEAAAEGEGAAAAGGKRRIEDLSIDEFLAGGFEDSDVELGDGEGESSGDEDAALAGGSSDEEDAEAAAAEAAALAAGGEEGGWASGAAGCRPGC